MRVKKIIVAPLLAIAVAAALATPASAEGQWTSYISGANSGFLSRIWTDKNTDSTSTNIYFEDCNDPYLFVNQYGVNVSIYRQVFGIDPNEGTKRLCDSSPTEYWGDMKKGDYRFKIGTAYELDVDYVRVRY